MITFQDKIEMFQGIRRYDPSTGDAVLVGQSSPPNPVIVDPAVEVPPTTDPPPPSE